MYRIVCLAGKLIFKQFAGFLFLPRSCAVLGFARVLSRNSAPSGDLHVLSESIGDSGNTIASHLRVAVFGIDRAFEAFKKIERKVSIFIEIAYI